MATKKTENTIWQINFTSGAFPGMVSFDTEKEARDHLSIVQYDHWILYRITKMDEK